MSRPIPPELDLAQKAYLKLTNQRVSQTELQRLSAALASGMSIDDAANSVHAFFSEPIDWDAERALLAARIEAGR